MTDAPAREVPMRVHLPFGERLSVGTITNDVDDLGNAVAEGRMHPSQFWPRLAVRRSDRAARAERAFVAYRAERESRDYAAGWVDRWLAATTREGDG